MVATICLRGGCVFCPATFADFLQGALIRVTIDFRLNSPSSQEGLFVPFGRGSCRILACNWSEGTFRHMPVPSGGSLEPCQPPGDSRKGTGCRVTRGVATTGSFGLVASLAFQLWPARFPGGKKTNKKQECHFGWTTSCNWSVVYPHGDSSTQKNMNASPADNPCLRPRFRVVEGSASSTLAKYSSQAA